MLVPPFAVESPSATPAGRSADLSSWSPPRTPFAPARRPLPSAVSRPASPLAVSPSARNCTQGQLGELLVYSCLLGGLLGLHLYAGVGGTRLEPSVIGRYHTSKIRVPPVTVEVGMSRMMFSESNLNRWEVTCCPVTTTTGPTVRLAEAAEVHQSFVTSPGAPPVGATMNPSASPVVPRGIAGVPAEVKVSEQNAVMRSTNTRPEMVNTVWAATAPVVPATNVHDWRTCLSEVSDWPG